MKEWFISRKGAVTLLVLAWITEIWRSFLDAMFIISLEFGDEIRMYAASFIFTGLFTLWTWTICLTHRNSRKGTIAAFLLNGVILFAIPISWIFFYCPAECRATAGIFNLANTFNLFFGVLAAISSGFLIWSFKQPARSKSLVKA